MMEGNYGKEAFDLRLTVLRLLRCAPILLAVTAVGTLLFGGGYYLKNVTFRGADSYETKSTYRVSFVDEPSKAGDYYINEMTWNTYVHSEEFLTAVWEHCMAGNGLQTASPVDLADLIAAKLDSDVHVPSTIVVTDKPEWTDVLAAAVERAMTEDFPRSNEQVASVAVIDSAAPAARVVPDVRPLRALVLSALLSGFFAVILFLLKELGDDSIWLPRTLSVRYGLKAAGTIHSPFLVSNLGYLFRDAHRIAVCGAEEIDPMQVSGALRSMVDSEKESGAGFVPEWTPVPAPLLCGESCEALREMDGVLLVVKAGCHTGKPLEFALEYLKNQDVTVTAALLWDADEWLIRNYYRLPTADTGYTEEMEESGESV